MFSGPQSRGFIRPGHGFKRWFPFVYTFWPGGIDHQLIPEAVAFFPSGSILHKHLLALYKDGLL
jgi:hypothetical protein